MRILFTYLTSFSGHGGIEKFNKSFIKTLDEYNEVTSLKVVSLHDHEKDERYFNGGEFLSYQGRKIPYLFNILKLVISYDILIIGHINLAIVGMIAKIIKPSIKIIIITHGIDIWMKLSLIKKIALKKAYKILSVSQYTKNKLVELYKLSPEKITVFPNTIDPFIVPPSHFEKPSFLVNRYNISSRDNVLLTICRLSSNEAYKGCDKVISCLPQILNKFPESKYLIIGKYDQDEKNRLDKLINYYGVEKHVIFAGFIPEEELMAHFLLGDLFIMPSINEGFGIVYIEAMASGVPVIAGNQDGSVDALDNGKLGHLVNPNDNEQIIEAVENVLSQPKGSRQIKIDLQKQVYAKFGYENYKNRLIKVLKDL